MIAFMLSMKVNEFMEQEPKIYSNQQARTDQNWHPARKFRRLVNSVKNDINVLLVEKREGKTTGAHNVAKALDLNYASISVGAQNRKARVFGFIDANGNFVETEFYKIFKKRWFILNWWTDAGNAGLTSINSAL
jgi:hypothetical protein